MCVTEGGEGGEGTEGTEGMEKEGSYGSLCDGGDDFDFDTAAAGVNVADIICAEEEEAEGGYTL